MAFDERAFVAAHEPWTFTDRRGRVWTPRREMSAPRALYWRKAFSDAEVENDIDRYRSLASRFVREVFPTSIWRWFRYLWSGDPYGCFMGLSADAQRAAINDFFRPRRPLRSPPVPRRSSNPSSPNTPTRMSGSAAAS